MLLPMNYSRVPRVYVIFEQLANVVSVDARNRVIILPCALSYNIVFCSLILCVKMLTLLSASLGKMTTSFTVNPPLFRYFFLSAYFLRLGLSNENFAFLNSNLSFKPESNYVRKSSNILLPQGRKTMLNEINICK